MSVIKTDTDTAYKANPPRYHCHCMHCAYVAVRAKREAAEHAAFQHVVYAHGVQNPSQ